MNAQINDLNVGNAFVDDAIDIRLLHFIDACLRQCEIVPENIVAVSVGLSFGEVTCCRPFRVGRGTGNIAGVKVPAVVENVGEVLLGWVF